MARIRTVKPEFWTSEQVMEISPLARLAFIALWTFSDDNGVHPASYKTLRAEAFAGDDITADAVAGLVSEMLREGLLGDFESNGKRYWFVTGWGKHQRIDKPTYRHPVPPTESLCPGVVVEHSTNPPRALEESSPAERNGMEWNGKEAMAFVPGKPETFDVVADSPPTCPANDIVALYHELMPLNPPVKVLSETRKRAIRARWKEAALLTSKPFGYINRQEGLAAWREFFMVCAESEFLTGRAVASPGRPPFVANIDFLMSPKGFAGCLENKYHRGGA